MNIAVMGDKLLREAGMATAELDKQGRRRRRDLYLGLA